MHKTRIDTEVKIKLMTKKIFQIMLCRFSIDLFALKKYRILHIENLTSNRKISGIRLLMNRAMINSILPTILKFKIRKKGSGDVNFETYSKIYPNFNQND